MQMKERCLQKLQPTDSRWPLTNRVIVCWRFWIAFKDYADISHRKDPRNRVPQAACPHNHDVRISSFMLM